MAYRDKSQGIAFVYTDLRTLLAKNFNGELPEGAPVPTENAVQVNLNKDTDLAKRESPPQVSAEDRKVALNQIRQNLDRLQSLHHKLHAILGDINSRTDKKKR